MNPVDAYMFFVAIAAPLIVWLGRLVMAETKRIAARTAANDDYW